MIICEPWSSSQVRLDWMDKMPSFRITRNEYVFVWDWRADDSIARLSQI